MEITRPVTFEITETQRFRRQNLRYDGSRIELNSCRLEGRVLNLSLTGIAIETPNRILVGGEYSLRLACDGLEADVVGRVQWCRMKGTRGASNGDVHPVFHAGVALIRYQDDIFDLLVERVRTPVEAPRSCEPVTGADELDEEAAVNAA